MAGTILITGANGSLALGAIRYLLEQYHGMCLVATVRDTSEDDANTRRLRLLLAEFPHVQSHVRQLDLSLLSAVKTFASDLAAEVKDGKIPKIKSIVCNAYYWNLVSDFDLTDDGFEKTLQINHISHAVLVLGLLDRFDASGGRVILFSSDAHGPGKNSLEKYPPTLPEDLEQLARPQPDEPKDNFGQGFKRYAQSKLAIVLWMYALNEYLQRKDLSLAHVTAVAINPGNLSDSRALTVNTPFTIQLMSRLIIRPFGQLLRFMDPTMRTATEAGVDVARLATAEAHAGERGYFTLLEKQSSSDDSLNSVLQQAMWVKTLEWTQADIQ